MTAGNACRELEPLLALRASGELPAADASRLEPHLESCQRCREELAVYREALDLARIPAPQDAAVPQNVTRVPVPMAELPQDGSLELATLAAYRRRRRRRVTALTIGAGFAAAAVAASVVLVPAMLTLRSLPPRANPSAASIARTVDGPTANGVGLVESSASSDDVITPEEAVLAALDEVL
jgi:anti-sigma factor RsiW